MIGRAFRALLMLGIFSVALPLWILLLAFALLCGTGAGMLAYVLLRFLVLGVDTGQNVETTLGQLGMLLCLLPAWAVALYFWAQYCGLTPLFTRLVQGSHGSARFSSKAERAALQRGDGLLIGRDAETNRLLRYDGPAHLITLAPTRAGKGVGTIIPNLLTANRPVLVIDPKGENARITAVARQKFGTVHVLDPFGVTGLPGAAYNPLDRLTADSPDLGEDAAALAEALQDIARDAERPQAAEKPQEALGSRSGVSGPLMAPEGPEAATERVTGRSEALTAPEAATEPPEPLSAAPRPAERLAEPQRTARAAQPPALFLLDEFAALGRLEAVERAMGLMAGYGIQLWPILQDMSQLKDLYVTRANTFIANAGVQQVFGVNDFETAKWLSQSIGQETRAYQSTSHKPGEPDSTTTSVTGRDLLTPDEIMQMPPEVQLLRIQGQPVTVARKLRYYADPEFRGLFEPQTGTNP